MSKSIRLDPRHGVNPMIVNCFFCGEASSIALMGKMKGEVKAALKEAGAPCYDDAAPSKGIVLDKEPCPKCKDFMTQGVILISVDEEKTTDTKNPYRSGGWCVVKDKAIRDLLQPEELVEHVLSTRVAFIPDTVWDYMELPRDTELRIGKDDDELERKKK